MSRSSLDASRRHFGRRTGGPDAILGAVGVPELRRKVMRTGDIGAAFAKGAGMPCEKSSSA